MALGKESAASLTDLLDIRLRRALEEAERNPECSAKELAVLVCLSYARLERLAKAQTGCSLGQHLGQLRMRRALELLRESDKSVKEIASLLGYAQPPNFVRAFKRTFGESPGGLRRHILLIKSAKRLTQWA